MYSITQKLSILFILLTPFQMAWSQIDTTTLTLNNQIACPGDTILIPVTVENFTNVTGVQFFVNWDAMQMQYIGVCDLAVGDPNSVVQQIGNQGTLSIFWLEFVSGSEVSLPDGDTLMVFKMLVTDIDANGIPIDISQTGPQPAEIVVFDSMGSFQFFTPNINNATISFNDNVNLMAVAESITCTDTIASLSGSANNPSTIYEWIGPDGFSALSVDTVTTTPGLYTLVGVDGNCVDTAFVEVLLDTLPPMDIMIMSDTLDCNNPVITLEATSSDNAVEYSWLTPNAGTLDGATQMVSESGTYELTATSTNNGCIASDTIIITEDLEEPDAAIVLDAGITCISDSVVLSVETMVMDVVYDWQLPTGGVVNDADSLIAFEEGTYILTATDSTNGCFTTVDTLIIANLDAPFVSFAGLTQLNCNTDTLVLAGTSFEPNVNFQWLDGNDNILSDSAMVNIIAAGFYEVQGTNPVNGCVGNEIVEVTGDFVAPNPMINAAGTTINCVQDFQVLQGQSDVGLSTFQWTTESGEVLDMDFELLVDSSGTYNLTVTSLLNGCDSTISQLITVDTLAPDIILNTPEDLSCFLNQTSLNASSTAPNTLCTWDGFGPGCDIFVDTPGTYQVSITNVDNGCIAIDSVVVNQVSEPFDIFPTVDASLNCSVTTANLMVADTIPNVIYTWVNELGDTIGAGITLEVFDGGIYAVQAVDTLTNCPSENIVLVEQDTTPPIAFIDVLNAQLDCVTDSLMLNATTGPNTTLVWENEMGMALDSNIVTLPGTYFAVLTDTTSNCTALDSIEVQSVVNLPAIDLSFGVDSILTCINTTVSLSANIDPNFEVTWLDSTLSVVSLTDILDVTEAGTYTAIVFNPINNCSNVDSLTVLAELDEPDVMIEVSNSINCQLEEATVSAISDNQNLVFEWSDEQGMTVSNVDSLITSQAGTYSLTVLDTTSNCDIDLNAFVVGSLVNPEIDFIGDTELTCQMDTLSLNAMSGNTDVVFQWLDAQGNIIADDVNAEIDAAGIYTLVGLDTLNFCDSLVVVSITESIVRPEVSIAVETDTITCDQPTSLLEGTTNLAQANISWMDENGNEVANMLNYSAEAAGTYFLTILDESNGCDSTAVVTIEQDTITPDITINQPDAITCQDTLVSLEISSSTVGVECIWEGIADNCIVEVNEAGTYTATVVNPINGCEASAAVDVESNVIEIIPTPMADGVIDCNNNSILLSTGNVSGNTTYTWTNELNDTIGSGPNIESLEGGIITLTIVDLFSMCSGSATVEVMVDTIAPGTEVSIDDQIDCDNPSVSLMSNPTAGILVVWQDPNGNTIENDLAEAEGFYFATFTNPQNGCTAVDSVEVIADLEEPSLTIDIDGNDLITCINEEVTLVANTDIGIGTVWTNEAGDPIGVDNQQIVTEGGTYIVVALNETNGCSATASQLIQENTTTPIANIVIDIPFDCSSQEASISTAENPNYSYEWTNIDPTNIESPQAAQTFIFEAGNYSLLVTDNQNGCTNTASLLVEGGISSIVGFDLLVDQPDCNAQEQIGSVQVLDIIGGSGPYTYTFQGEDFGDKNTYLDLSPGTYQLAVQDINGCTADTTLVINPSIPHEVMIVADQNPLRLGGTVNLGLEFNVPINLISSITWLSGDSIICNGCETWSESLSDNAFYTVLTTDINGCTSEDVIEIFISRQRDVFMPNVFSPNEDGFNDLLFVQGGEEISQVLNYKIFDRWGALIFKAENFGINDETVSWNGTQNGQDAAPGVYVYLVEVEYIDGERIIFSGDVTLLR